MYDVRPSRSLKSLQSNELQVFKFFVIVENDESKKRVSFTTATNLNAMNERNRLHSAELAIPNN